MVTILFLGRKSIKKNLGSACAAGPAVGPVAVLTGLKPLLFLDFQPVTVLRVSSENRSINFSPFSDRSHIPPKLTRAFVQSCRGGHGGRGLCPIANAVPTAEGAIQLAMEATDRTIHGSHCLVIGYGRIGRLLAERLAALGAQVSVSARRYRDLAWIDAVGCRGLRTNALAGELDRFDLIFNTVPALILDAGRLEETREDCVILELASSPGGVDFDAARRLGRRALLASGLPGKSAPRTAAAAIRDSIYHILEERGEPI